MLELQLPPIPPPESALLPGMAAPMPQNTPQTLFPMTGGFPNIPDSSIPGPLAQLEENPGWIYDIDPANGQMRATFNGEVTFTSGGAAGSVTSFNTRTGAITLTAADVTGVGALVNPSVALTGTPTAPTAAPGTSTTQIATTNFVGAAIAAQPLAFLPLAGGAVTGATTFGATLGVTGAVTLQGNQTVNGAVLIGTSGQWGLGAAQMVCETTNAPAANFANTIGSCINARTDNAGNLLTFFYQTTAVGSISINSSATTYNTSSDRNLKTAIEPINREMVSEAIDLIEPVSFEWKNEPELGRQYGFIAQQVADIFPGAVTPSVGTYGEDGYIPWQINTLALVPLLLAELQSLRQRVAILESSR